MDLEGLSQVSLLQLAEGAMGERFDHEFERLLDNALDPNRDAEAPRTIMLKVSLKPNEKRNGGHLEMTVASKLAPLSAVKEGVHFCRIPDTGMPVAINFDPGQHDLFREKPAEDVLPIDGKKPKEG